jgi:hypothetical protein
VNSASSNATLASQRTNIERLPYREMCDATFPLSRAAKALDKRGRREVTRAGLLPG